LLTCLFSQDWVHDVSVDVKGKGRADGARPMNAKAAAAAEVAKRDADLRAQYVVVPRGEEAKPVACPICKEQFKSEWLEDEDAEDWVWRNAVLKDDRVRTFTLYTYCDSVSNYFSFLQVYHATCHAEAASGLALRLRSRELANLRSHSNTPESVVGAARGAVTPPPSGLKISDALRSVSLSPSPESKLVGTKRKVDDTDRSVSAEAEGTPRLKKLAVESMPQ
jgi:pre-mRNA cleavage complex 2 protein Pcf11